MSEKLVYKPLDRLSKSQIMEQLEKGTEADLIQLPLSVGEYSDNWKDAQDVCLKVIIWDIEKLLCKEK